VFVGWRRGPAVECSAFGACRIFGDKEPISFETNLKVTLDLRQFSTGGIIKPVSLQSLVGLYLSRK
jgi:hypothetical protein